MTDSPAEQSPSTPTPLWQKALLIVGGIAFAFLMVAVVLTLFPGLVGANDPIERTSAGTTIDVEFRYNDGDLFAWMPGRIRPVEDNAIIAAYTIAWDDEGFRIPAMQADHYPIIVFGDSFTEGPNVGMPWPDLLATELDVPVRNYGYRAYGPREIAITAQEVAAEDAQAPDWVIYAHFSGNDFAQANIPDDQLIDERSPVYLIPFLADPSRNRDDDTPLNPDAQYDFPMPVIIGGNFYEMAILDAYIWWQIAPETGFENNNSYRSIAESLDTVRATVGDETCRVLLFIPTKGQLYYRYIHDGVRQFMRQNAQRPAVQENGNLDLEPYTVSEADEPDFISQFNDQRDAMAQMAAEHGWHFIDLVPAFTEAVANGELLYYQYDTHWNQAGHDLAARTIAAEMRAIPGCGLDG